MSRNRYIGDYHLADSLDERGRIRTKVEYVGDLYSFVQKPENISSAKRKVLCLCDLDTVMPGSVLYDIGDALRYGCNMASEEETDLSKVSFNLDYFKALVKGFISAGKEENITEEEIIREHYAILSRQEETKSISKAINSIIKENKKYKARKLVISFE